MPHKPTRFHHLIPWPINLQFDFKNIAYQTLACKLSHKHLLLYHKTTTFAASINRSDQKHEQSVSTSNWRLAYPSPLSFKLHRTH